jgi:hypothetical protein
MTVDGKVLIQRAQLNGELTALFFEGGDGELVVSNVEYRR